MSIRIKICCVASQAEAGTAVRCGADALGLVSAMPSGPGVIDESLIAAIAAAAPAGVSTFLLTALTEPQAIAAQHRRCLTDTVQLVDRLDPAQRRTLRRLLPDTRIVQVVHVGGHGALDEAREAAVGAHALLLDSGRPDALTRILGGTGDTHDWSLSRRIVERSPVPVYLAGGLRAANVAEAIARVRPFGVDVCSGVRRDGSLDESALAAFVRAARG